MKSYKELIQKTLANGEWHSNRTAQQTVSIFGHHMSFDLREGFPLVTEKFVPTKPVIGELVGFIRGYTNSNDFKALGCGIWDDNANSDYWMANPNRQHVEGDLGRIYGAQWRGWRALDAGNWPIEIDQLYNLIEGIRRDPHGRRHIVSAWNVGELDEMALPPCHVLFQCHVSKHGYLDMQMYQRSVDVFLGLPFNIASYAALLSLIAQYVGLQPRFLHMALGDCHLYENQIDGAELVLERDSRALPKLEITTTALCPLDEVAPSDFVITGYDPHPAIKVAMVV